MVALSIHTYANVGPNIWLRSAYIHGTSIVTDTRHRQFNFLISPYEFSQPPEYYVETCTSFYVFSGLRWLTRWVRYWTPNKPHHYSSTYHRPTPPPWQHYLRHTIGNKCTSWLGMICPVRREPVPFLNAAKMLISSCLHTAAIDGRIDRSKYVVMIHKLT
jgi:hypothetical protein